MNDQSNLPVFPGSAGTADWFSIWVKAVTKPDEQTYSEMAEHPDAQTVGHALSWVFIAGTLAALISDVLTGIVGLAGYSVRSPLDQYTGGSASPADLASIGIAICASPILGAIGVLAFAIFVGVTQWLARMFNGTGTYSQLAYVMAAIAAPFNLISAFLTPFSGVPVLGIFIGLAGLVASIYVLYLEITAVKGVNKFGYGQAAGSVLIPAIVVFCCVAVVLVGLAQAYSNFSISIP